MSDATMAVLARDLARHLMDYARDRRPDSQKEIQLLHHLICIEYRNEEAAPEPKPDG